MAENKANKDFLQSAEWRKFQEANGQKTFAINAGGFSASIIGHGLPLAGKYFYVPRGPVMQHAIWNMEQEDGFKKLINLDKENNIGWIRIEPESEETLEIIKRNISYKVVRAPHDMQPK